PVADAMRTRCAGGADRITQPAHPKRGRHVGRQGRAHGFRDGVRADPLRTFLARDVGGLDLGGSRRPARAHHQAGALVADVPVVEARIDDRLGHGDVIVGRTVTHEAPQLTVDMVVEIDVRRTVDMGAKAHFLIGIAMDNARATFAQACCNFGGIRAYGGDDAEAGNGDAAQAVHTHQSDFSLGGNRPTRRPWAV
ncbi:MAG: hypothetical protein CFH36_02221, partial [Alphaproteobacteria bacterium MarineAlpha9_Bin6]